MLTLELQSEGFDPSGTILANSRLNVPFSPFPSSRPLSCGGPGAVHLQHQ